jgi:hypothetical protein
LQPVEKLCDVAHLQSACITHGSHGRRAIARLNRDGSSRASTDNIDLGPFIVHRMLRKYRSANRLT